MAAVAAAAAAASAAVAGAAERRHAGNQRLCRTNPDEEPHEHTTMTHSLRRILVGSLMLSIVTAALAGQSITIRLPDGSRWTGEVQNRIDLTYTQRGVRIHAEVTLVRATEYFITVEIDIAGEIRRQTIFTNDIVAMKTLGDVAVLDVARDGARRQGDGIGVDHAADIGLLRRLDPEQQRTEGKGGAQDDLGDGEVGQDDLLGQPREVADETEAHLQGDAFMVDDVHALGDEDDGDRGDDAEGEEQRTVIMARKQQP